MTPARRRRTRVRRSWDREPVLWMGAIQAGIALLVSFGLHLTPEQIGALLAFSAMLALITRRKVSPRRAGSEEDDA